MSIKDDCSPHDRTQRCRSQVRSTAPAAVLHNWAFVIGNCRGGLSVIAVVACASFTCTRNACCRGNAGLDALVAGMAVLMPAFDPPLGRCTRCVSAPKNISDPEGPSFTQTKRWAVVPNERVIMAAATFPYLLAIQPTISELSLLSPLQDPADISEPVLGDPHRPAVCVDRPPAHLTAAAAASPRCRRHPPPQQQPHCRQFEQHSWPRAAGPEHSGDGAGDAGDPGGFRPRPRWRVG